MARKNGYYPVARKTTIGLKTTPGLPDSIVYVDKVMSELNRRLYRQHRVYNVKLSLDQADEAQSHLDVYALAPTWWVMNAISQAKKHFDVATAEELAQGGKSRWHDFRISTGISTASELQAKLRDLASGEAVPSDMEGEYLYSRIFDSSGNTKIFALQGASSTSQYNIFDEYDLMGSVNRQPETGGVDAGYAGITDELDSENVDELNERGNLPPYDYEDLPSLMWVKVGQLYRTTNGNQSLTTGFFDAPLGIVYLPGFNATTADLTLEVAAGDYKGLKSHAI